MTYSEYIETLTKLKATSEGRIIAIIPSFKDFAYKALIDWIDMSLDVKNGHLVASSETIAALNNFDAAFLKVLNGMAKYEGAVSGLVKDLPKMASTMRTFQESANNISWAAANVGPTQKLVVNEIIKSYTDNGINKEFVQPLRDMIYQNIAAGTSKREVKAILEDYVKGGEAPTKFERYLTQTSQQATDSYTGAINKKLMSTFDYPYLQMSGSLIKTSTPQCVKGINEYDGLITKEIWENELKPLAVKNGMVEGTTWENLAFNRNHWNCRHEFTPTMVKL